MLNIPDSIVYSCKLDSGTTFLASNLAALSSYESLIAHPRHLHTVRAATSCQLLRKNKKRGGGAAAGLLG